jgi:hypothetical protein
MHLSQTTRSPLINRGKLFKQPGPLLFERGSRRVWTLYDYTFHFVLSPCSVLIAVEDLYAQLWSIGSFARVENEPVKMWDCFETASLLKRKRGCATRSAKPAWASLCFALDRV